MPTRTRRPRRNDALSAALGYFRDLGVREVHLPKRTATPGTAEVTTRPRAVPEMARAAWAIALRGRAGRVPRLSSASLLLEPGLRPGGRRLLPALRALPNPDADRIRGWHGPEPAHVRGRGSRRRRGRHGGTLRRPRRATPDEDGRVRDGAVEERRLHRERAEVPAAREPEPGAGGDRRPAARTWTRRSTS